MNLDPNLDDFIKVEAIGFTNAFKFMGHHKSMYYSDFTAYYEADTACNGNMRIFALREYTGQRYIHKTLAKQLLAEWVEENSDEGEDEG